MTTSEREAKAWDEGYRAGHADAEKYEHNMDANPHRIACTCSPGTGGPSDACGVIGDHDGTAREDGGDRG